MMKPKRILALTIFFIAVLLSPGFAIKEQSYYGQIIPKDFIPFSAPQNTLDLPFWGSSSNGIRLSSIEPEGKKVKAGECIAEFAFRMTGAKDTLDRRFPQIKAQNEKALLDMQKRIIGLHQKLEVLKLKTEKAALDLQKKDHLSRIKQRILDCNFNLLSFETDALKHKLKTAIENLEIQKQLFAKNEKTWVNYYSIYEATKARYKIYAPEDGYLYYPILRNQKRKVISGDRFNSGVHFLSLARSDKSELIFYLPEKDILKAKVGGQVFIELAKEEELEAKIREIGFFPQLIGDVMKDYHLPNAWDKCFVVKADILVDIKASNTGSVKVRLGK